MISCIIASSLSGFVENTSHWKFSPPVVILLEARDLLLRRCVKIFITDIPLMNESE